MEKYFFKIVDNIDFVWKINTHVLDPYKQGEIDFGHYVSNQRVFNPYIFETLTYNTFINHIFELGGHSPYIYNSLTSKGYALCCFMEIIKSSFKV